MPNATGPGEPKADTWTPPYIAFRTFLNLVERMERDDCPPRIDRSYLTGSEGSKTQVVAALKALDLIGANGSVEPKFIAIVKQPDNRKALIRELLESYYAAPLGLPKNATQGMLEDTFGEYGVTGDTRRKAISFFLKGAKFAGLSLSKNFKTPASGGRKKGSRAKGQGSPGTDDDFEDDEQDDAPSSLRDRYIEMLLKKADEKEEMDDVLLNRIEKLLGFLEEGK